MLRAAKVKAMREPIDMEQMLCSKTGRIRKRFFMKFPRLRRGNFIRIWNMPGLLCQCVRNAYRNDRGGLPFCKDFQP